MNDDNNGRLLRKRTRTPTVDHPSTQEEKDEKSEQLAHVCGSCGKVYSREYKLRQHERMEHHVEMFLGSISRFDHQIDSILHSMLALNSGYDLTTLA